MVQATEVKCKRLVTTSETIKLDTNYLNKHSVFPNWDEVVL